MGHENAYIQGKLGDVTLRAEEGDAVHDVYWQPTHGEEEDHQGQRFGQLQLLAIVPVSIASSFSTAVKLSPDHPKDLPIKSDHYGQRCHHPAEEIEVHHVVHPHDGGEFTDNVAGNAEVFLSVAVIPSNHWNQSGQEGEDPTQTNCHICPPLGHDGAVPVQGHCKRTKEVCQSSKCTRAYYRISISLNKCQSVQEHFLFF